MPKHFFNNSGKAEIVILILLIIFGTVLVGGLKPYRKPLPPLATAQRATMQDIQSQEHKSLQLGGLIPITGTPSSSTASTPGINFASPTLDWDDADQAYLKSCTTISTECRSQLRQAVIAEVGDPDEKAILPGSRAYLCQKNVACQATGYSAYNDSTPLPPAFIPTTDCQQEYQACVKANPNALFLYSYTSTTGTYDMELAGAGDNNCDWSDNICVPIYTGPEKSTPPCTGSQCGNGTYNTPPRGI